MKQELCKKADIENLKRRLGKYKIHKDKEIRKSLLISLIFNTFTKLNS